MCYLHFEVIDLHYALCSALIIYSDHTYLGYEVHSRENVRSVSRGICNGCVRGWGGCKGRVMGGGRGCLGRVKVELQGTCRGGLLSGGLRIEIQNKK